MISRGDVWLASLDPTKGTDGERVVIVVSRDAINRNSPLLIVVPVAEKSDKKKIYPSQVVLAAGDGGLTLDSVALCELVRSIRSSRLVRQLGRLAPRAIVDLGAALKIALDL